MLLPVTVDFETYRDRFINLSRMSGEEYVRDRRMQPLGLGVKVGDDRPRWLEPWEISSWVAGINWSRAELRAHNLQFDGSILAWRYGVRAARYFCTESASRIYSGSGVWHGLAPLAQRLGLPPKLEMPPVIGRYRDQISQKMWNEMGVYCLRDVEIADGAARIIRPTLPQLELDLINWTIGVYLDPRLEIDQPVIDQVIAEDAADAANVFTRVGRALGIIPYDREAAPAELVQIATSLRSKPRYAALLRKAGVEIGMKSGKRGSQIAVARNDPWFLNLQKTTDETVKALVDGRLRATSNIVRTRGEELKAVGLRGALPVFLNYCGAHTQRWSGGGGNNLQNLNRSEEGKLGLRNAIIAPKGYVILVADSSQIEPRVLAELAGETTLIEMFRREIQTREDLYSQIGNFLIGYVLGIVISKKEKRLRQVSKALTLGLGYNMAGDALSINLCRGFLGIPAIWFTDADRERFKLQPPEYDRQVPDELIEAGMSPGQAQVHHLVCSYLVQEYRKKFPAIVRSWRAGGDALYMMMQPDADAGRVGIKHIKPGFERLIKPTGTSLIYKNLRTVRSARGHEYHFEERPGKWHKIYGGKLIENVTQSVARDVVAYQMIRAIERGVDVRLMSHDEAVAIAKESDADAHLKILGEEMVKAPPFMPGLYLNYEGKIGHSYADAK